MPNKSTFKSLGYCPGCGYGTPAKHRRNGYAKCPNDNPKDNAAAQAKCATSEAEDRATFEAIFLGED